MILNGLTITIVGMAIVFAFLIILVLAINLLFAFLKRFLPKALEPKADEAASPEAHLQPPSQGPGDDLAEIAAVVAATRAHILTHFRG